MTLDLVQGYTRCLAAGALRLVDHEAPTEHHGAVAVATVGAVRAFVLCQETHKLARTHLVAPESEPGEALPGNGPGAVLADREHYGGDMLC
jgi:hypothetical protein